TTLTIANNRCLTLEPSVNDS
ncbi:rRNA large subunit m3Psi methyltransferase RlmH, partial [Vibrio parahaemolyticus VP2007-007]